MLAIVKETRSKGVYVRTLVAAVALNNIACIAAFEMARSGVALTLDETATTSTLGVMLAPLMQLGGAAALGGFIGLALVLSTKHVINSGQLTTVSIISIFLTTGLADFLGVSHLLACLFLGVTLVNIAPEKEEIGHRVFVNFEPALLAIFFTLAGMELDFGFLADGWLLVALFVVARIVGKTFAGVLAMRIAGGTENVRRYLGLGLIPQAGIAVGLLLQLADNPIFASISPLILAVGVTAVAVNEIIGPITTRIGLARSGDLGMDRARLIDFIHEENIATDFPGRDQGRGHRQARRSAGDQPRPERRARGPDRGRAATGAPDVQLHRPGAGGALRRPAGGERSWPAFWRSAGRACRSPRPTAFPSAASCC